MAGNPIEVSIKGRWVTVPALEIGGNSIVVRGSWLKVAAVHDEEWLEAELQGAERHVKRLKEQGSDGLHADIFTFTQRVPGSLSRYEYAVEWDSIAAARTTSFKAWWEKLPQETRKNVRRSQRRDVVVTVKPFDDDLVRGIMSVNDDSPMRQGMPNTHYGKTFDQTRKDHSSFLDRSDFICVCLGNELIGFLKIVYRGDVASILNLAVKPSCYDKRPANALIAKGVELCEVRGVSHLTYGMFNYGNKRGGPLREFKIRNGFEEFPTPRYYVPLTPWGQLCVALKLHRGLLRILPHRVITIVVNARARWYRFKQLMSRCSSMVERPNRNRQTGCSIPPAGSDL